MRLTVENLRFDLDVFLWENPDWAKADVVVEYTSGGRVYARRPLPAKGKHPFDIQWEEKVIYEDLANRRLDDGE